MRLLVALVSLCVLAVPVVAQQEGTATLKMDGSPALADPGTPVAMNTFPYYPEEYVGNRFVEKVKIRSTTRLRRGAESLFDIRITERATGDGNKEFRTALVPFVTADETLGRYLIEKSHEVAELNARILFHVELFTFEAFRNGRYNSEKPFYCANIYRVELTDKDGKTVATVP